MTENSAVGAIGGWAVNVLGHPCGKPHQPMTGAISLSSSHDPCDWIGDIVAWARTHMVDLASLSVVGMSFAGQARECTTAWAFWEIVEGILEELAASSYLAVVTVAGTEYAQPVGRRQRATHDIMLEGRFQDGWCQFATTLYNLLHQPHIHCPDPLTARQLAALDTATLELRGATMIVRSSFNGGRPVILPTEPWLTPWDKIQRMLASRSGRIYEERSRALPPAASRLAA